MNYRKLRIAFSVTCGIACVLLVVLWVRSYRVNDNLSFRTNKQSIGSFKSYVTIISNWGFLQFMSSDLLDHGVLIYWNQPAWERSDVGFEWRDDGAIKVPDVFAIVVTMTAGVAPWLNYKRFSLRTLLIAITIFGLILGLIIATTR